MRLLVACGEVEHSSILCIFSLPDDDETREAFTAHFEEQLELYRHVAIISLIEQAGREAIVGTAFMKHILLHDNPDLTYITFDFHDYW